MGRMDEMPASREGATISQLASVVGSVHTASPFSRGQLLAIAATVTVLLALLLLIAFIPVSGKPHAPTLLELVIGSTRVVI